MPLYLLHPLFLHFPIALLVLGFGAGLAALKSGSPAWLGPAAKVSLLAGALLLWGVLGLGLLAEHTAPHVPDAWQVMAAHKRGAYETAWAFTALSLLYFFTRSRPKAWPWVLAGWALGLGLLIYTAHLGATLAFTYGVGGPAC